MQTPSWHDLRNRDTAPYADQAEEDAQDNVQGCNQQVARSQIGESFPFKCRECAVGADKTGGSQVSPGGIEVRVPAEELKRETDNDARSHVDYKCSVRKPCAPFAGNIRADPEAGQSTKRTSKRDEKIFLQALSLLTSRVALQERNGRAIPFYKKGIEERGFATP